MPDFDKGGGEEEDVGKPERSPVGLTFPFYDPAVGKGHSVSVDVQPEFYCFLFFLREERTGGVCTEFNSLS